AQADDALPVLRHRHLRAFDPLALRQRDEPDPLREGARRRLRKMDRLGRGGGRGRECGDERREQEEDGRPHCASPEWRVGGGAGWWKSPIGSTTPRRSNLPIDARRRPVEWSPPEIVPSDATSSTRNLKISCIVITSASIRCTSVIAVTRREPSSSRSRWT